METKLLNLINYDQMYLVVVQKKNQEKQLWEDEEIENCSDSVIYGKDIATAYPAIRKEFITLVLKHFRFSLIPYRLAIFSNYAHHDETPIISEYPDKTMLRFALTSPDFYKDYLGILGVLKELDLAGRQLTPFYINNFREIPYSQYSEYSLKKIDEMKKEINDNALVPCLEKANHSFDVYLLNFLKIYDTGGIFKTKWDEDAPKRKKNKK